MKKAYQSPQSFHLTLEAESVIAGSGNFGGSGDDIIIQGYGRNYGPWSSENIFPTAEKKATW